MSSEMPSFGSGVVNIGITIGGSLASLNPLIGTISEILNAIFQINEKAQYNKRISSSILARLLSVEAAIKYLLVKKEDFIDKFNDLKYLEALHSLKNVLDRIKVFTEQVTQLKGFEKVINAQNIEKNFKDLIEDYNKEQTNLVYQEIKNIKTRINSDDLIDIRSIEPTLLNDPPYGDDLFDESDLDPNDSINKVIQNEFKNLIQEAWKHESGARIRIPALYSRLSELSSIVKKSPSLIPIDSRTNNSLSVPEDFRDNVNRILTVEEGIKLHRTRIPENKEKAWKCFVDNAKLKSPLAIYWKGYYLWEGSYPNGAKRSEEQKEIDKSEARELFKKAAEEGVTDAQFWYAFSLPRTEENRAEFLHHLSEAAENGNAAALYSLGDVYLYGKAHVEMDKTKGLRYLKLAAHRGHLKATETLKNLDKNMLDIDVNFDINEP
ncbi:7420_t:CDS:2 [Cetraspora pellucida]|uniref:7420_t:CDS:1 n=1 Tax=Cetraspora pellucida TaxID=1433469 RepID=A0A9N9GNS1_9GLOM|nr:7420_t:CDS:2 [Cetraspora pellucida]